MNTRLRTRFLLAAMLAGTFTAAQAAGPATYRCGGIGTDESQQMKADARNHSMMLTFASATGAYLADVTVDIRSAKGESVVSAKCSGPIMLVDVPDAGTYQILAQYNGVGKQQALQAGPGKGASATFTWPAN